MVNYYFEVIVNLIQSIYFIGFFFAFLGGKFSTKINVISLISFIGLNFAILTYFTFHEPYIIMLDMVIGIALYEIYCLLFLKGEVAIKIILPLLVSLINTIISYGFLYSTSIVTGFSFEEFVLQSSFFRYVCVGLVNLTTITVLFIMWRTKAKDYSLRKVSNIIAFVAIPIFAMAILYITAYIMILTNFQSNIAILLSIICISMIFVAGIVWFMIAKINKDNQIKTKLLLSEQRADLYEKNIISTNEQIESIIKLKHDMKNNIACIENLIQSENYKEAAVICRNLTDKYSLVGSIVNTKNNLLNAVLNVELEKARQYNILVKLVINTDMKIFSNESDMISIIGNIFDNAISYLSQNPIDDKEIVFTTNQTGAYTVIKCSNKIINSVLSDNPSLQTSKADKKNHGKGISIIKSIACKYNGDVIISEDNDKFLVSVILDNRSLPKTD